MANGQLPMANYQWPVEFELQSKGPNWQLTIGNWQLVSAGGGNRCRWREPTARDANRMSALGTNERARE
jgi:hypothetical protein